ncbi:hypothetical protein JCM3775_003385 [Rhodotorula graminis]
MNSAPSTSTSSLATGLKIAGAVVGVLSAATVVYAAVWDHRRRHDPAFRRKLAKQQKKLEKVAEVKQEQGKAQVEQALRRALTLVNAEPVPESPEGKEQFFMEQVALGEQLAARSPEFYVASAISFYKALKVYPAPQELLMIYQKTQPPAVFDLVMELISLDLQSSASSSSQQSSGPRRSEAPILDLADEGDDEDKNVQQQNEDEEEIEVGGGGASSASASAPRSQATTSDNGDESSPSSGGSFVHVETDTVVTPEGDVAAQATETAVVDVPAAVVEAAEGAAEQLAKEDPPEPVAA